MIAFKFGEKVILEFLFFTFSVVSAGQYENNPFLTGALPSGTKAHPKDSNQWNIIQILPSPDKHQQAGQLPGFVWVQAPTSNGGISQVNVPIVGGTQQTLGGVQGGQKVPETQVNADPQHPAGDDLNSRCLKPRGQFPSKACNKFVNCWDGVATEQECPGDLLFNPRGYCDHPQNVNCAGKPLEGSSATPIFSDVTPSWTSPSPFSSGQSSNPTSSGNTPTTSSSATTASNVVTPPPVISVDSALKQKCLKPRGQFPSTTCNRYVNCWDGSVVEQECPEGLLFSPKGYCDYPANVHCGERSRIKEYESAPELMSECPLEFGTFRDRNNCSSYYTCIGSKIVARYNCHHGFKFNDNIGVCDYESRVDCSKEPLIFQGRSNSLLPEYEKPDVNFQCPVEFGTFRDSKNCSTYFTCVAYKIVSKHDCPSGFYFNDEIGVCDYYNRVDCERPTKIFQFKTNLVPQLPKDYMDKINNCTPGTVFRLNPQCTAACLCRNGVAEIVQCPQGFAYDSSLDKCLSPQVAKC